jgi:hypothetical protein
MTCIYIDASGPTFYYTLQVLSLQVSVETANCNGFQELCDAYTAEANLLVAASVLL